MGSGHNGLQQHGPNYWKGEEGRLALIAGKAKLTDEAWVAPYRQLAKWKDYLGDGFEAQTYPDSPKSVYPWSCGCLSGRFMGNFRF